LSANSFTAINEQDKVGRIPLSRLKALKRREGLFSFATISVTDSWTSPYYCRSFRSVAGRSGKAQYRDCYLPAAADPVAVVIAAAVVAAVAAVESEL
jgi:predicted dithiol-disulfide oxidoreductase (DUF899 family)